MTFAALLRLIANGGSAPLAGSSLIDFVNPKSVAAFFFCALRFLVAVLSDLSGCRFVLRTLLSKLSRRS